jgi:two-component system, NtrC family, nitrogen regulation sensor histidine kinase NtrY
MRRSFLYGLGVVLLILSATLVIWEGSFTFGDYAPTSPVQTILYWAVSTLVFLLTVTLGFMLFRTAAKLYVERRSNREGSRIKTKLVAGALALSFMPVFFLVLWSISVLNRNLDKWFSGPAEGIRGSLSRIINSGWDEARQKADEQATALAASPPVHALLSRYAGSLATYCREHGIAEAVLTNTSGKVVARCGTDGPGVVWGTAARPVALDGRVVGTVLAGVHAPKDLTALTKYISDYDRLAAERKAIRNFYILLLLLITLFVLFFATWLALFLAKQISNPISALLAAAGEVRKGNLGYRIEARAADEMGTLVRAFNAMTYELEANSRELDLRRRFTEAILESIPTGVISVGADGRILRVNRAFRDMFSEERVAQASRLEDLFTRDDTAEFKYLMKRARRTGAAQRQLELKASPHGTRQISVTVAALEEKLTSGFVIVLEDTSDLLRIQKLAAWHEVARRIAHEIKNPLTPIALSSDRIARQVDRLLLPPDTERILRECTATISNEVESVKTLVDEFAQFARFPAAQPAPCDLNEVVENALGVFAGRLDGIEIHRDLAPGLAPVNVDREQFKRAVVNLVDNAAESMQDSLLKHLYVRTQPTGAESIELTVADTGCGISPEDKDRLFLPYFSTKGRGTGLGLAIVSHILSEHKATIRVEDNMPQGARFIIEVPVIVAGDPEPKPLEVRA